VISPVFGNYASYRLKIHLSYLFSFVEPLLAYVERFSRTVRYDWLNQYIFETIEQVQGVATKWLWTYNKERPNMALGGITPIQKLALGKASFPRAA
jgi:transposase InsO family protein